MWRFYWVNWGDPLALVVTSYPILGILPEALSLFARKNSRTDWYGGWVVQVERDKECIRAAYSWGWVSTLYWTRDWKSHYLGHGFPGSRVSCLFFLIWSEVSCHDTRHLGSTWFDPAPCGVLPGQDSDFPDSWPFLPLCCPSGICLSQINCQL